MQAAKNWCDEERVKKLGILRWSKHGPGGWSLSVSFRALTFDQTLESTQPEVVEDEAAGHKLTSRAQAMCLPTKEPKDKHPAPCSEASKPSVWKDARNWIHPRTYACSFVQTLQSASAGKKGRYIFDSTEPKRRMSVRLKRILCLISNQIEELMCVFKSKIERVVFTFCTFLFVDRAFFYSSIMHTYVWPLSVFRYMHWLPRSIKQICPSWRFLSFGPFWYFSVPHPLPMQIFPTALFYHVQTVLVPASLEANHVFVFRSPIWLCGDDVCRLGWSRWNQIWQYII